MEHKKAFQSKANCPLANRSHETMGLEGGPYDAIEGRGLVPSSCDRYIPRTKKVKFPFQGINHI